MRRVWFMLAGLAVLLTSCNATLTVSGRAPTLDNQGTCSTPQLTPRPATQPVWIYFDATGPVTVRDSVQLAASGAAWSFAPVVPSGTYTVRVHAADAGGHGCDTTFTRTVSATPWKPSVN